MKFFTQKLYALALVLCCTVTSLAAAPSLVINGNKLVGANNVNVGGALYDVAFIDGTCLSLFAGCAGSALAFNTYAQAQAASLALFQDVFKNGPLGNFNTSPELTAGCNMGIGCMVLTPYSVVGANVYYSSIDNTAGTGFYSQTNSNFYVASSYSTTPWNDKTFAVWSVAAPVAEPQTYAMLLAGLGLMTTLASRRKKAPRA